MKNNYSLIAGIFTLAAGVVVFVLSFFSQPLEITIALLIAAAGLIASGIAQSGHAQNRKQDEEKHRQIMEKLDKLEEKIDKLEQPKNNGVAIADVISSGLKYYTEHFSQQKDTKDD